MILYAPPLPYVQVYCNKNPICTGETATFLAATYNTNYAYYQWYINNTIIPGETNSKYITSNLDSDDLIHCSITGSTSSKFFWSYIGSGGLSNQIQMRVNKKNRPQISIDYIKYVGSEGGPLPAPSKNICSGDTCYFFSTYQYGGTSPIFQWARSYDGGLTWAIIPGQNNSSMLYVPSDGEKILCGMGSSLFCVDPTGVTSNTLIMNAPAKLPVSVTISSEPSGSICVGDSVIYTANGINKGTSPTYKWYVNQTLQLNSLSAFTYTPSAGDLISVSMTSSLTCKTGSPALTSTITDVLPYVTPSLTINSTPLPIGGRVSGSTGQQIFFFVSNYNGMCDTTTPSFEWWRINDEPPDTKVATNVTYWTATVNTNIYQDNQVYCKFTSDCTCTTVNPAESNHITLDVSSNTGTSVTIAQFPLNPVCTGTTIGFSATTFGFNGGETYQWKRNGSNVGTNSRYYSSNSLLSGDTIYCYVTKTGYSPATSNTLSVDIRQKVTPSVSISKVPPYTTCEGQFITCYLSTGLYLGTNPTYNWQVDNGGGYFTIKTGSGSEYYYFQSSNLANGDKVRLWVTNINHFCITTDQAYSNEVTISITSQIVPSVSIICDSTVLKTNMTFTATPTNGGAPTYIWWYLNGANWYSVTTGTNNVWNTNFLASLGSTQVYCEMTSSIQCANPNPVQSNVITFTGCACPEGYQPYPDSSGCWSAYTYTPYGSNAPITVGHFNGIPYSQAGSLFFPVDGYINQTGEAIDTNQVTGLTNLNSPSGLWQNTNSSNGPLNRCAIWKQDDQYWEGICNFSFCFNAPSTKIYYVGLGADNYATVKIDTEPQLIVKQDVYKLKQQFGYADGTVTFKYWFVYPFLIKAGSRVLNLEGTNDGNMGCVGIEIYDATLQQLLTCPDVSTLQSLTIFSTRNYYDQSIPNGLTCDGNDVLTCGGTIYCTKTLTEPCQ